MKRPSNSPSRDRRIVSGATNSASSPSFSRKAGFFGMAALGLPGRERLVEDSAARLDRRLERRHQRPMQIVDTSTTS